MKKGMIRYTLVSLSPYAILILACLLGGNWGWVALGYITLFVAVLDTLPVAGLAPRENQRSGSLLAAIAGAHFLLLSLTLLAIARGNLGIGQLLALGIAVALCFGQVSNSAAHELIHRGNRWLRGVGTAIYVSLLFGHHVSAHLRVHHIWVASDRDPNSARRGEGFWRFFIRAWIGSFRAGLAAERALRQGRGINPYVIYVLGALGLLVVAGVMGGLRGVIGLLLISGYAQMQLLMADYVQHYGLRRKALPNGKLEPAGPQHSWNAPHWYSSAMMLNAPRHSDHHQNPSRDFAALRLSEGMPVWPYSMPVMAFIAAIPPLWRRVMAPHVRAVAQQSE